MDFFTYPINCIRVNVEIPFWEISLNVFRQTRYSAHRYGLRNAVNRLLYTSYHICLKLGMEMFHHTFLAYPIYSYSDP
jgi:hypothetical protein